MQTIALIGHGTYFDCRTLLRTYDTVIALDGGYEFCKKNGIEPTVTLGDGDSIKTAPTNFQHLPDQTTTDLQKGLAYIQHTYQDYQIDLFGFASLDRLDHTLSAISLLMVDPVIQSLYTPYQRLQVIQGRQEVQDVSDFSLLPLTPTAIVEITGASWSGTFTLGKTYSGLSNRAIQDTIQITVQSGSVLFVGSRPWM